MRTTTTRNVLAAICMTATLFLSFENEHPVGNTGSPLDGICSDCHTPSGNFSGPITFEFNDLGANSYIYTDINVGVAAKFGFQGTPGFLLNGVPVKGAYPVTHFDGIIAELKKRGKIK